MLQILAKQSVFCSLYWKLLWTLVGSGGYVIQKSSWQSCDSKGFNSSQWCSLKCLYCPVMMYMHVLGNKWKDHFSFGDRTVMHTAKVHWRVPFTKFLRLPKNTLWKRGLENVNRCFVWRDKSKWAFAVDFSPMLRKAVDSSYCKFGKNGAVCLFSEIQSWVVTCKHEALVTSQWKIALPSPSSGEYDDTCRAHYWSYAWQDQAGEFCANGVAAGRENGECCHEHHNELAGQLPCWCWSSAECCTDKVSKSWEVALGFWAGWKMGGMWWFFSLQILVLSGTCCWCSRSSYTCMNVSLPTQLQIHGRMGVHARGEVQQNCSTIRSDLWLLFQCQAYAIQHSQP